MGIANPRLDIDTKINILLSYYVITESHDTLKQQAFELADILVSTHPSEAKAYSIRADFLARDMKYEAARADLLKVISIDSSRYIIWELLLRMDAGLNDFSAAYAHSSRAIALFPMQPFPYLMEGLALLQEKKYQDAVKSLKRGSGLVVDDRELMSDFSMYLGDAHYQAGNVQEAFKAYEKVLQLDPANAYVLNNYSYYLSLRKENLAKAASMAKKANEISPDNPSFQDTYAWVLYQQGYYQEALPWIEKAIAGDEDPSAEIFEHYGDILYKLGRTDEAYKYWIKASETGEGSTYLPQKIREKKLYE
jgi:tetratricopeptide (TPR) repeat protein